MATTKKEIHEVLNYFVKTSLPEEESFRNDLWKEGIKVCDRVYQKKDKDGKDVVTVISHLKEDRKQGELKDGDTKQETSDYYIKRIEVSQAIPFIDDDEYDDDDFDTNVKTVIGKRHSGVEAVYNAKIKYSSSGRKLVYHESYLRSSTRPNIKSDTLRRTVSLSDKSVNAINKEPGKKKKRFNFRGLKKNNKEKVNYSDIGKLAKEHVSSQKQDKKSSYRPLDFNANLPFKSHEIGEIPKLNKPKVRSYSIFNIFGSPQTPLDVKHSKKEQRKEYSADLEHMDAKNVIVTMVDENEVTYKTDSSNIICDNEFPDDCIFGGDLHVDMKPMTRNQKHKSCPSLVCNCGSRQIEVIVKALLQINDQKPEEEILQLTADYNHETKHFFDCFYHDEDMIMDDKSWKQSQMSLYMHCDICDNTDEQLSPAVFDSLVPIANNIDDSHKTQLTEEFLDIFKSSTCYDHFEKYVTQLIGCGCSPYNLARLHDITRRIVRHIGDPNKDNCDIRRILKFSEQLYCDYFETHIRTVHQNSIVKFLEECRCEVFLDVD